MRTNYEKVKKYRERHKHPCIDCGKLCDFRVIRCKSCASTLAWMRQRNLPPKESRINKCIDCGKQISWSNTRMPKRCRECSMIQLRIRNSIKGENHPSWKGGRFKGTDGYIFVYRPEHPRAHRHGYVREHILIWEETHGKPLPEGWMVHHLNGIPNDNRPKNLVGMPSKKHYLLLQAKAKRIQELEALLNNQGHLI